MSSPSDFVPSGGCANSGGTRRRTVRLNAAALSEPDSLFIPVSFPSRPSFTSTGLVDCGSSHCFIDTRFVNKLDLSPYRIRPVKLRLLDGSLGSRITHAVDLRIRHSTGDIFVVTFLVTHLDPPVALVFGYTWFYRYNPLIDWYKGQILSFQTPSQVSKPTPIGPRLPELRPTDSDRGSEFVSHFFRSLGTALGMKLHFTSGYHPEGDGQTEQVNQTLEQYLRAYCNYQQDNWSELLPLAEFAYNNAPSETTGVSPFFANKGYHPNLAIHPERDLASNRAREYAVDLGELHDYLKTEMAEAQQRHRAAADTRRMPPPDFTLGERAYVREKYFRTRRPTKKLAEKYLGPYELIAQVGTHSFTLRLPEELRSVHPVFHVSMLEPHTPSTIPNRTEPPPAPVEVEGDLEYEIAEILDTKIDKRRRCKLLYYVRWLGYEGTDEETSWLPADELGHAADLVKEFHRRYPDKPGPT